MNEFKKYAKRGCSLFALLGLTSYIGSIQHGNPSFASAMLFGWSMGFLVILNLPKE